MPKFNIHYLEEHEDTITKLIQLRKLKSTKNSRVDVIDELIPTMYREMCDRYLNKVVLITNTLDYGFSTIWADKVSCDFMTQRYGGKLQIRQNAGLIGTVRKINSIERHEIIHETQLINIELDCIFNRFVFLIQMHGNNTFTAVTRNGFKLKQPNKTDELESDINCIVNNSCS